MEMLQNDQDENYIPPELVNQGTIKRYSDLPTSYPTNINLRKPQPIPSNYNNSYTNQNIPINPNLLKSQESQTQKKEKIVPEEKPIIPDKTISDFFQNEFLADAILKVDENEIKFHKVVLCAASEFLYKYFTLNKSNEGLQTVALPEIMKSSFSRGNKKECAEKILKYCYNNQDIKSIEGDITQYNCFTMLELAHCLGIKSLNKNLEKIIIKQFLKDDNMIKISEESNNFELPELHKECSNRIKKKIGNVSNKSKELTELNYETFKDIISSDEIDLEGEKEVADLVLEYIKSRREIPEEKIEEKIVEKVEIKVNQEEANNENPEEKKEEEKKEEEKKDEENQEEEKKEEEPKEENQNVEENKPQENAPPQSNEDDPYNLWKKHLEELEQNSKKKKLTKDEEKALVYCIRFSFLSHADLISLSNDPIMGDYKDLLLQGLSARLNTYENTDEQKPLINLTPRHYLRGQQASNINQNMSKNNLYDNENMNQNRNYDQNPMLKSVGNFGEQNQYMKQFNNPSRNFAHTYQNVSPSNNEMNINSNNINNNFSESRSYYEENNNFNNYNNSNQMRSDLMNIDDINSKKKKLAMMIKSSTSPYPPQDPRISEDFFRNQLIMSVPKPIFKYTYDFDENGALYYLGTKGKRHQYRNPHEINMVKAFASSISKGQVSDFVGRNLVNLRTENEENSFFGVDLGKNRTLVPTAYSLRNRNSSSHVMLCWNLEASNDKINFEILDTRIFSNVNNPQIHQKLEKERNLLREPGCTSTWGISKKIKERFPEGFRYFLIKQIDKNSNGSYNLAISGFELYGEGKGKGWIFNQNSNY